MKFSKFFFTLFIVFFVNHVFASSAPWVGSDFRGHSCSGSDTDTWYGPYDYSKTSGQKHLVVVHQHHFTSDVENLIKGKEGYIAQDLNYTVMASPNHHRALLSMIRFQLGIDNKIIKYKNDKAQLLPTPLECYFYRAFNFNKDDPVPLSLFAYYLTKINRLNEAKKYYESALKIQPDSSKIAYSYALLLLELKEYDKALEIAKVAYKDKSAPPGLRKKLQDLKIWEH